MDKNQFDEQIKLIKTNMENIEEFVRLMYANQLIDNVEGQSELQKINSSIIKLRNEHMTLRDISTSINALGNMNNLLKREIDNLKRNNVQGQMELQEINSSINAIRNDNNLLRQEIADLKALIEATKKNNPDTEKNIITIKQLKNFRARYYQGENPILWRDNGEIFYCGENFRYIILENNAIRISFRVILCGYYYEQEEQFFILQKRNNDIIDIEICTSLKNVCYNAGLYVIKCTSIGEKLLGNKKKDIL